MNDTVARGVLLSGEEVTEVVSVDKATFESEMAELEAADPKLRYKNKPVRPPIDKKGNLVVHRLSEGVYETPGGLWTFKKIGSEWQVFSDGFYNSTWPSLRQAREAVKSMKTFYSRSG